MNETYFNLELGDHPLKLEKHLIEIQKTIIYFGKLNQITLEKILTHINDPKVTCKEIIPLDKPSGSKQSYILKHLNRLKL